jgi:F-type H+-transporting ATPase subunit gamma
MPHERELAARIASLNELAEIITAIRAIAASQMQQALRSVETIRDYSKVIGEGLRDAATLLPQPVEAAPRLGRTALIFFGAEHGLCGAFNQAPLRALGQEIAEKTENPIIIVVGSRAARLCRERRVDLDLALPMATHYAGVTATARRVSAELYRIIGEQQVARVEVIFVSSEGQLLKIERQQLLPIDLSAGKIPSSRLPPLINLSPRRLLDAIIDEYLFAGLENAAMQSFFSENLSRFRTMEAAHQNIRKKSGELTMLARRTRQENVTSEILDLISGTEALTRFQN